jgi:hypothetical protein
MAYRDFSYPKVLTQLGLTVREADLASEAAPLPVGEEVAAFLQEGLGIAVGALGVCTEKAKSEFIIAPMLIQLRRAMGRRFSIFSGMELNVNKGRKLNGSCDFVLTKGPNQHLREAPIVGILEAKNEERSLQGLGQCVAAMVGAQLRNQKDGWSVARVCGAVTTGRSWQFLYLEGSVLTLERSDFRAPDLPMVMGILKHQIECALTVPGKVDGTVKQAAEHERIA